MLSSNATKSNKIFPNCLTKRIVLKDKQIAALTFISMNLTFCGNLSGYQRKNKKWEIEIF